MSSEIDGVKQFGDLSLDEKVDLFRYYHEGGEIEYYNTFKGRWLYEDYPSFIKTCRYRKKLKIEKLLHYFGLNNRTEVIFDAIDNYIVRGIYTSPEGYTIVVRDSK